MTAPLAPNLPTRARAAAVALNQSSLDWDGNLARIEAALDEARALGVSLVCLPDLSITGRGCEDLFRAPFVAETALAQLALLAPRTHGLFVAVGLPLAHEGALFVASAVLFDGALLAFMPKEELSPGPLFDERRVFSPWPRGQQATARVGGREIPIGAFDFDVSGARIGLDLGLASPSIEAARARSLDVLLCPSASPFALGRAEPRRAAALGRAALFDASVLVANGLGDESGTVIFDGHALVAARSLAGGEVVAATLHETRRFSFRDHALVAADVPLRAREVASNVELTIRVEGALAVPDQPLSPAPAPSWESGPARAFEELSRALALGLFDYLRRSRTGGFVVSLSGGVDSALVATSVALMVRLAREELGAEGLLARLAHLPGLAEARDERALVRELLTTLYQATQQSGAKTRHAARALAEELGAHHHELDIDALVEGYVERVEGAIGRPLGWDRDDAALQNIQARTRGPMAWLFANLEGKLLLATSNRSEVAVGYATMDGDTVGCLAPIASLDKHGLRAYLAWLASEASGGLRVAALSHVAALAPTAELRPPERMQTDEDDLMPYDVLERIERLVVHERGTPLEALMVLRRERPSEDLRTLATWIERFVRLFFRNLWKRERYAPGFHLDDASLDAKSAFRAPILSSGLARELAELRAFVEAEAEPGERA